jgi:hypothetical protein
MQDIQDMRMWSTTAAGFSNLIGDFARIGIYSSNVHTLAEKLKNNNLYPVRDFGHHFNNQKPDLFISYDWRTNFIDLQVAIWSGLDYIASFLFNKYPEYDIEHLIANEITIWVDFMFIDQNSRDIKSELAAVLPTVINSSDIHFVLSPTALQRAWCCYELGLFNKRFFNESPGLYSFLTPAMLNYVGWRDAATTDPTDKMELDKKLADNFPGESFDFMMMQASLQGELYFEKGNTIQSQLAIQQAVKSAEKWIKRMDEKFQ